MHVIDLLIQKEGQRLLPMCVYDIQYACSVLLKTGSNGTVSQAQQTMCMTGVLQQRCTQKILFFFCSIRNMAPLISPVEELSACHRK